MSKSKTLAITFYHLKPFPVELRSTFKLPAYPYIASGNKLDDVSDFFQKYGIVFCRDERHSRALLIQPQDGNPEPLEDRQNWKAYRTCCLLAFKGLHIVEWPKDVNPTKYKNVIEAHGDAYSWWMWNKEVTILEMGDIAVKTA